MDFTWSLLGYNASGAVIIGGGLGYFISYEVGSFLAQCINFPLQRNITFKSIDKEVVRNYLKHLDALKYKNTTIGRKMSSLRSFYDFLVVFFIF